MRPRFDLLLVTDEADRLLERFTALGGVLCSRVAVLLRRKQHTERALREQALALRLITRAHGASLLISGHLEIALFSEADGVQLPESGPSIRAARELLGAARIVGVSAHDASRLLAAQRDCADYATLSPVFASPNKGAPLGLRAFGEMARTVRLPVFALGGVRAEHVPELAREGAAGVAVIREVWSASEPNRALTSLLSALASACPPTINSSEPHPTLAGWGDAG